MAAHQAAAEGPSADKMQALLERKNLTKTLPSSNSLMSLAACIPSSFKFFSICLLRSKAARSSALIVQPIFAFRSLLRAQATVCIPQSTEGYGRPNRRSERAYFSSSHQHQCTLIIHDHAGLRKSSEKSSVILA